MIRSTLNIATLGRDIIDRQRGFVRMDYLIDQSGADAPPRLVRGWAFQTPGWLEFHACVRFDIIFPHDTFNTWQIDQYESGLACGGIPTISCKEEAPEALAKRLNELGREKVHALMRKNGLL